MDVMNEVIQALQKKCMATARRDVADELNALKDGLPILRKELAELRRWKRSAQKRLDQVVDREADIALAEKEICFIMGKIDKIREEKVTTKTTSVRSFATGSRTGNGWYGASTPKARALSAIRRRMEKQSK